jgi:uncharacterized protein (TIGR03083 family)
MTTPPFDDLLSLIDDRSAALRAAAAAVPADARVPSCPEWSVHDLVAHLGEVQRFWAAVAAAGPSAAPPDDDEVPDRTPHGDLLAWSAESTGKLIAALRAAGPDLDCWTWWSASSAPETVGALARHQVQEAAVHARDAQEAAGHAEPLPALIGTDGVDEFLTVCLGACGPWPYQPARVAVRAAGGPQWLLDLGEEGAVVSAPAAAAASSPAPEPAASLSASASDLVLALYGRLSLDAIGVDGDRSVIEQLIDWGPRD